MHDTKKAQEFRRGVAVLAILAVLTLVEFGIAIATSLWFVLVAIALVKAAIVIQYFMHLPRVFSEEGGH